MKRIEKILKRIGIAIVTACIATLLVALLIVICGYALIFSIKTFGPEGAIIGPAVILFLGMFLGALCSPP